MYKAYHFKLPENMLSKFEFANAGYYSLRNKNKFKVKFARTTLKHNCLSSKGIKLFNSIPDQISSIPTLLGFKKKYKIHIDITVYLILPIASLSPAQLSVRRMYYYIIS